jgi:hypothetical protein
MINHTQAQTGTRRRQRAYDTAQLTAAAAYEAAEELATQVGRELNTVTDPAARACLLEQMAAQEQIRAALFRQAYPSLADDAEQEEKSFAMGAALLRAVAGAERALATGEPRTPADPHLEAAGAAALDELAAESYPPLRAEHLRKLHADVKDIVSDQHGLLLWLARTQEQSAAPRTPREDRWARRPDWATAGFCQVTGHRLGTAGHRHAHRNGRRCRPTWWRLLPLWRSPNR